MVTLIDFLASSALQTSFFPVAHPVMELCFADHPVTVTIKQFEKTVRFDISRKEAPYLFMLCQQVVYIVLRHVPVLVRVVELERVMIRTPMLQVTHIAASAESGEQSIMPA